MHHHIFLSYSRQDAVIMRTIREDLHAAGLTIWMDEKLTPGTPAWKKAIEQAIDDAACLVVVLSPDAKGSEWVGREIDYAALQGHPIFPVLVRGNDRSSVPFALAGMQFVDLQTDYSAGLHSLISAIQSHLGVQNHNTSLLSQAVGDIRQDVKGIPQVFVPAGSFWMGSDPPKDPDAKLAEQPAHQVHITRAYWIDKFVVTNNSYQQFIEEDGYKQRQFWTPVGWRWVNDYDIGGPEDYQGFTDPQQPRVGIAWFEASAYARWRGGRLPTEAEWEYAARGPEGRIYPWGNDYQPAYLNADKHVGSTTPVTLYPQGQSWCGAFDMAGNVWEWVSDWYSDKQYEERVEKNPLGPSSGAHRVVRGGSWYAARAATRSAARARYDPYSRHDDRGVRIVCAVDEALLGDP